VATTTDAAADRAGDGQHGADDQQQDPQPLEDADVGDQPHDDEDDSKNDHDASKAICGRSFGI
jgi:hypothetical protein